MRALDAGGTLAVAGIHLSDIPALHYDTDLFREKQLRSVTANTDGRIDPVTCKLNLGGGAGSDRAAGTRTPDGISTWSTTSEPSSRSRAAQCRSAPFR